MKKQMLFVLISFIMTGSLFASNWKNFGKEITLKDTTLISTILQKPEAFVGKKVLVKGRVVDVCKKRGCWMEIASDLPYQTIRVKVKDGEIVFPLEARGKEAIVEGIVEKLVFSKKDLLKAMKHQAKEHGEPFDSTKITEGKTVYRLRGLGAKIKMIK